jgi:hypothetical protein
VQPLPVRAPSVRAEPDAIEHGHVHVADDQMNAIAREPRQPFLTVAGFDDFITRLPGVRCPQRCGLTRMADDEYSLGRFAGLRKT